MSARSFLPSPWTARRLQAPSSIRLGLVGGGLFSVLYGVLQAEGDLGDAGSGLIFLVAAVGLVLILAAGYRWLATREQTGQT